VISAKFADVAGQPLYAGYALNGLPPNEIPLLSFSFSPHVPQTNSGSTSGAGHASPLGDVTLTLSSSLRNSPVGRELSHLYLTGQTVPWVEIRIYNARPELLSVLQARVSVPVTVAGQPAESVVSTRTPYLLIKLIDVSVDQLSVTATVSAVLVYQKILRTYRA
jgi:hypothetical protein